MVDGRLTRCQNIYSKIKNPLQNAWDFLFSPRLFYKDMELRPLHRSVEYDTFAMQGGVINGSHQAEASEPDRRSEDDAVEVDSLSVQLFDLEREPGEAHTHGRVWDRDRGVRTETREAPPLDTELHPVSHGASRHELVPDAGLLTIEGSGVPLDESGEREPLVVHE